MVRLEHGIGGFVARGAALVSVAGYEPEPVVLSEALMKQLNDCFTLGRQRTIEQDVGFGLRQVVDIALKALSPGINDTTTAIISIDHLGALLAQLADRRLEAPRRADHHQVRLVAVRPTFAGFVASAFDQIRVSADGNVAVYLRLLTALATIGQRTAGATRREPLRQQADLIAEAARRTLATDYERAQVRQRLEQVLPGLTA